VGVEDDTRKIVTLVDDGRERAADQCRDDLVGERDQAVPHDAEADSVEGRRAHGCVSLQALSSAIRLKWLSTVTESPAPITHVLSCSSIRAGPLTIAPGASA